MKMRIEQKVAALEALYRIEARFDRGSEPVCCRGCACCCTARVIMTTLEGYYIASFLEGRKEAALFERIRRRQTADRFRPRVTTNELAEICLSGEDPPAEAPDGHTGTCPVLEESRCPLYPVRPLSCRTMTSTVDCAGTGFAQMDDFSVTVGTVLMQYVEHLDADGCSGGFSDVMSAFAARADRQRYREGTFSCADRRLLANRPLRTLMIPPEHRQQIRPLLDEIAQIRV